MTLFAKEFADLVLPFGAEAAAVFADQGLVRDQLGHPVAVEDGTILAIASTRAATVVTRDVGGFARCDVATIDPLGKRDRCRPALAKLLMALYRCYLMQLSTKSLDLLQKALE